MNTLQDWIHEVIMRNVMWGYYPLEEIIEELEHELVDLRQLQQEQEAELDAELEEDESEDDAELEEDEGDSEEINNGLEQ